ncbi:MAG: potassium-transporting ATPase subunit KdpC [Bdellovibrionales bacterium]|nr:potassium-transporting ATPase subunit KdpC [Bdellovibrionales bacterium]
MKTIFVSIKLLLVMTILTGIIYPLVSTVIGSVFFSRQMQGSFLRNEKGEVVGSEWIAQSFKEPKYFWPRPSANSYDPQSSGGSNLGPTSQTLVEQVHLRRQSGLEGELLFASASGLDPHISPSSAILQLDRVAQARGWSQEKVRVMIGKFTEGRQWGFLGEPRVNVLKLNLALDLVRN